MPRPPLHEIRRGLIIARVWSRNTRTGPRPTVTLTRLYRDGEAWKESARFGVSDIPLMQIVLDEAYEWILEHSRSKS